MKKVLLACTVPALDVYSIGIVSASLKNEQLDCFACVFLDGNDNRSEKEHLDRFGLSEKEQHKIHFYKLHQNKIARILSGPRYLDLVKDLAALYKVTYVHFITQDVMLYGHLKKFRDFKLYYTVHDLVPHPVKLSPLVRLKHYYFRIRKDALLIKAIPNLVTNSDHQLQRLLDLYPNKQVYHHPMPGIRPAIERGTSKVPELKEIENYILFFGKIEAYKGVAELYQAFFQSPFLSNYKLVIAGTGFIYFPRSSNEKDVVFINRFIVDEEVGDLFSKALLLAMPYQSATQSAVTAIAYHYHVPVVGSDIDGLRDTILHEKTGLLYDRSVPEALEAALQRMLSDSNLRQTVYDYLTSSMIYNEDLLRQKISMIYR